MTASLADYTQYVCEVLGAREVLLPAQEDLPVTALAGLGHAVGGNLPAAQEFDLLVLHEGSGLIGEASGELWQKMKSAMNLGAARVFEFEATDPDVESTLQTLLEVYPAKVALLLLKAPARMDGFRSLGTAKVIETFRPEMILQTPDLKRSVWRDLQHAMGALQTAVESKRS